MTKPSPILIGVIDDIYTPGDSSVRNTIEAGIAEVTASGRLDRTVELVYENVRGLPYGTTHDVRTVYRQMVERGVVGILGPTVTDNTLTVRPLADSLQMPSLTWPGSEEVRSEYVFQYQAGSLEDEPYVLARNAAARGLNRVFVIHDEAATGRRYAEFFEDAARVEGLVQVARVGISAAADELPSVFFDRIEQSAPDAIIHFGMFGSAPSRWASRQEVGRRRCSVTSSRRWRRTISRNGSPIWRIGSTSTWSLTETPRSKGSEPNSELGHREVRAW